MDPYQALANAIIEQLGYMIINAQYNICVGGSDYEYTLEDVNQFAECYC